MTSTKDALAALGWRVNTTARLNQAIKDFQRGWNLGPALVVDGIDGPKTRAALELSMERRKAGKSDFSAHFNAREFACACGGQYADCRRIWVVRNLVQAAEELRKVLGPFTPLRACRCPRQNKAVGGATKSQHLYGAAMDLGTEKQVYNVSVTTIRNLKRFSGIGYYDIGGGRTVVRHVDVRHASPTKTAGTISAPALWVYGSLGSRTVMNPRPELAVEPKPTAPAPAPAPAPKEDTMARISPEDFRVMTTGVEYAFYKNRHAADPDTAPRQPLGKTIEDATDAGLAAKRAVEELRAALPAMLAEALEEAVEKAVDKALADLRIVRDEKAA